MSKIQTSKFVNSARSYLTNLNNIFSDEILMQVGLCNDHLLEAWIEKKQVFICGNGGSAANAIHIANDLHYGIGACGEGPIIPGMRVEALPANAGIITCLANDTGYENIYAKQLMAKANDGDILIALSGSGNSSNIINAIKTAKDLNMKTIAVLAYSGGKCKDMADISIHFPINDMQIAEDTQLIIGHLCMQWLATNKPNQTK